MKLLVAGVDVVVKRAAAELRASCPVGPEAAGDGVVLFPEHHMGGAWATPLPRNHPRQRSGTHGLRRYYLKRHRVAHRRPGTPFRYRRRASDAYAEFE